MNESIDGGNILEVFFLRGEQIVYGTLREERGVGGFGIIEMYDRYMR